jgi:hypothetical protein
MLINHIEILYLDRALSSFVFVEEEREKAKDITCTEQINQECLKYSKCINIILQL